MNSHSTQNDRNYFPGHLGSALIVFTILNLLLQYLMVESQMTHLVFRSSIDEFGIVGCFGGLIFDQNFRIVTLFSAVLMSIISWNAFDRNDRKIPGGFLDKCLLFTPLFVLGIDSLVSIFSYFLLWM